MKKKDQSEMEEGAQGSTEVAVLKEVENIAADPIKVTNEKI